MNNSGWKGYNITSYYNYLDSKQELEYPKILQIEEKCVGDPFNGLHLDFAELEARVMCYSDLVYLSNANQAIADHLLTQLQVVEDDKVNKEKEQRQERVYSNLTKI